MSFAKRYSAEEQGTVTIIMAAFMAVMIALGGLVVDYAVAVHRKKSLEAAADAALLAAVNAAENAREQGRADWAAVGIDIAKKMFAANIPSGTNFEVSEFSPSFELVDSQLTATARYSGKSFTSFMSVFNKHDVALSGTAKASLGVPNYVDVHFIVDVSSSMGIGASQNDQQIMHNETKCAFACHQGFGVNDQRYRPERMNALGAKLRIDIVRDAVTKAIDQLKQKNQKTGKVRVALYAASEDLTVISELESNLDVVKQLASQIALTKGANGGSYLSKALDDVSGRIGVGGKGSSPDDRLSYVVFLSDGVDDSLTARFAANSSYLISDKLSRWRDTRPSSQPAYPADQSWLQAFDPAACGDMQRRGHKMLTIQIKYVAAVGFRDNPVDGKKVDYIRDTLTAPLVDAFQTCGVDGYVEAADSAAIEPQLKKVIDEIIAPQLVRISG